MKASELIKRLQQLIDEHGDLEVVDIDNKTPYQGDVYLSESVLYGDAFVIEFSD